ncbi:dicarboxylate/amino acid:cation symporter [Zymomonas mobilis]|uniref:Sodium:dicarboxylate symporter n=1 Tax=Zymomonas mobilis subsp. pomaceae (strain ATCC 29192 / DSM 22645 / JCM 10191 / CCUG 17912 / NBRC 13757 / NCIMB 11200 / NRRL B-4491 / Barker I) TaxID=579138 RepID=F8ERT3_ZYMMT|nr:dicarboxylate/amino acid:cation symporter [Zymomonas mobilis]AEI37541.1 sodium:dicarboxylate symporter [Zymomonas mobilis subsp. pomaceae ATCC 29192]MDX5948909.1 dicarboxylate/amino acid:cation symporter [Zymomonas mobilis subsp. pomaceae]GEB88715.1 proton glutamate symport protein [Zymomonas mobilis subsp. pomaceae]
MVKRLTFWIIAALVVGLIIGTIFNLTIHDQNWIEYLVDRLSLLTLIFLRLIKMIIAPLVFATLVSGIAHMGNGKELGRIGLRTMCWFIGASLLSLAMGLILVNLLRPGTGLNLVPPVSAAPVAPAADFSLKDFISHMVPQSMVDAMAHNEILQIVIFSVFFGLGLGSQGKKAAPLLKGVEALSAVMLKVTNYVMYFAPLAVFAAVTSVITQRGIGVVLTYGYFIGSFYLGLAVMWGLILLVTRLLVGKGVLNILPLLRSPALIAFTTSSSEASLPPTLEALEKFGVPPRIAGFVLPLGYSFNLDGTMIYCTFATMFIAQSYNIHVPIGQQIMMLLMLMITSKGMAGVPRASLVVIASTLSFMQIPEGGLWLILAVDHFLDMGRSATNVIGNAAASLVIAHWEGELKIPDKREVEKIQSA